MGALPLVAVSNENVVFAPSSEAATVTGIGEAAVTFVGGTPGTTAWVQRMTVVQVIVSYPMPTTSGTLTMSALDATVEPITSTGAVSEKLPAVTTDWFTMPDSSLFVTALLGGVIVTVPDTSVPVPR